MARARRETDPIPELVQRGATSRNIDERIELAELSRVRLARGSLGCRQEARRRSPEAMAVIRGGWMAVRDVRLSWGFSNILLWTPSALAGRPGRPAL